MPSTQGSPLSAASIKLHRRGSGPPLVLVHCLGVDHRLWDIAAADLEADFTLVSYDLPGHGETAVPARAYRVEDLSAQLAAVLDRAGLARVHVAGISLGGCVAQHFAAPTLIVVGKEDLPAFHESAAWLEKTVPGARKIVPGRHASILEQPQEFAEAARAFLRG
jgi:pimeloyl-ACP methyl ester carboxylesterase